MLNQQFQEPFVAIVVSSSSFELLIDFLISQKAFSFVNSFCTLNLSFKCLTVVPCALDTDDKCNGLYGFFLKIETLSFISSKVDPVRTISAGKVNLGAFRTYPKVKPILYLDFIIHHN